MRSVVIGLGSALALGAATPTNDLALGNTFIAGNHFPLGAFIVLFVLAVPVNLLLRRTGRPAPLRAGELITIWSMIVVSSGIPSSGLMRLLVPVPAGFHYFTTPDNEWAQYVAPHMPSWLVIAPGDASEWFFEGAPMGAGIPWRAWHAPTIAYGVFVFLFYLATVSAAALIRRQWETNERFTFPLCEMPLELAASAEGPVAGHDFLRHGGFWAVVLVLVALHSLNGLQRFRPSLPQFPFHFELGPYLTEPPWRYFGWVVLDTYPMMVGIAFFARNEVTFSIWFFYLLRRVQEAVASYLGIPPGTAVFGWGPNYLLYQQLGGYIGLLCWCVWIARGHIRLVMRKIRGGDGLDDRDEMLPYRLALAGLLVGMVGCIAWLKVAGATVTAAVVAIVGLMGSCVVMSWLITNGGTIMVQNRFSPSDLLVGLFGTRGRVAEAILPPRTLTVMPLFETIFHRDLREIMLPSLLNVSRASAAYVHRRQVLGACMLAVAAVTVLAYVLGVRIGYTWGAGVLPDSWAYAHCTTYPYDYAKRAIKDGITFEDHANLRNLLIGGGLVLGISVIRSCALRVALHPAGFLLAATYPGDRIWFSMLIAWVLKSTVQRLGGYGAMRSARPYVYGLVVGDGLAALVWIIVGWWLRNPDQRYFILPP